ncbi:Ig-like V-type domain-containing protein FAM187A [Hippoglossus stenolepis]|uniref:Ig-like V-type domain-containing protein FAM187A n=1 Tax=Hippoglossus stenolepis TaxID=195615 RepID=UPI001FAF0509|nr:Ig-like V-type domain-containing protein FAM187A [Hippoglossus stenolepis]
MPSSSSFLLLLLLLSREVWSYEAPEDKQDVFASRACPAFLSFTNAAYLAGVTVELPCRCKPQQVQSVLWFFRKHLGSSEETGALSHYHDNEQLDTGQVPHSDDLRSRFSIRLFSLLIFRTGPDDSGIYICGSAQKDFFYGYDLDVQEAHRISFTPRLAPERTGQKLMEIKSLSSSQPLYQVFTGFQPWTVCDRCGVRGEQVRVGLCYVRSQFLHVRYRRANQTVASCGSGAVPRAFGGLKQSRAEAKLEVRSCQVTCPPRPPPSSKLLTLMAFFGLSSASVPVEVPVFYLNHPTGHVLTLGCPGARADMAVAWDRGSEPIYRSKHLGGVNIGAEASRLQIDAGHHLVFKPAKLQDTGVYCCWLQGRPAAQIRLLVYLHFGRGQSVTSHPDFLTAINTVMISYAAMTTVFFLLVVVRAGVRCLRHVE